MSLKHLMISGLVLGSIATAVYGAELSFLAQFNNAGDYSADFGLQTMPTIVGTPETVQGLPALGIGNLALQLDRLNEYITFPAIGNVQPTDGISLGFWIKQSYDSALNGAISYKFGGVERLDSSPHGDSLVATYGEASAYRSAARGYDAEGTYYDANPTAWHHMISDQWLYYNIDVKTTSDGADGHYRLRVYNDAGSLLSGVGGAIAGTTAVPAGQQVAFNILDTTRVLLGGGPSYAGGGLGSNSKIVLDEFAIWNGSLSESEVDGIVADMVHGTALTAPVVTPPTPFTRPANYGKEWIRNHEFNIFSWAAEDVYSPHVKALNLTGIEARQSYQAANAQRENVIWNAYMEELYDAPALTPELKQRISNYIIQGGPAGAFELVDEPPIETMDNLGIIADWIREAHPQVMIFATAGYGLDDTYLDKMMTTIRPDVLMYDTYPILRNQAFDVDYHFQYLAVIRDKGKQYDVPTYAWLQTFADSERRIPSDSELRMQAYTYLAAGYKGLGHYRYNPSSGTTIFMGLLDLNGQPGPLFNVVSELNVEIRNLGEVLRFLDSSDIGFIPGSVGHRPDGLNYWSQGAGDNTYITAATVDLSNINYRGAGKDGMIGLFDDDEGNKYFMLVNLFQDALLSPDQTSLGFLLTFDPSIDQIWRLNRLTGETEMIALDNHTLRWVLPGGTGDLFSFQPAFVPEPGAAAWGMLVLLSAVRRPDRSIVHA